VRPELRAAPGGRFRGGVRPGWVPVHDQRRVGAFSDEALEVGNDLVAITDDHRAAKVIRIAPQALATRTRVGRVLVLALRERSRRHARRGGVAGRSAPRRRRGRAGAGWGRGPASRWRVERGCGACAAGGDGQPFPRGGTGV
jgi:hypothetical protein